MVFKHLNYLDQVCLAYACKQLAVVFEHVKPHKLSGTKANRLELLLRFRGWMGPGYKLCCGCLMFVKKAANGQWGGDVKLLDAQAPGKKPSIKKILDSGPRCVDCARRDRINALKARADVQSMKRKFRLAFGR